CDVPQHVATRARALVALAHRSIMLWEPGHEIIDRAFLEPGRDEALHLHIRHLEIQSHLAAENDELAGDVRAGQVISRIRLRVATLASIAHDVGERRLT